MAAIEAVVFDVYATLFHNEQTLLQQTFVHVVGEQHLPIEPLELYTRWRALERGFRRRRVNLETMEQVLPFESYEQAWRECFRQVFKDMGLPGDAQRAVERCLEGQATREPFSDTLPAFDELDGHFKLGVLSNADAGYLRTLLERAGLWQRLDVVLSSEEAQAYKPVPGPFREVLRRLGVAPQSVLFVGDTLAEDVLGAKNAGMRAAWLNRNGVPREPGSPIPDVELRSLAELPVVLRSETLAKDRPHPV